MSRFSEALNQANAEGRTGLIIYLCAGDPNLEVTPRLIQAVAEAGADIVEVGVPFSDPTADGPAIEQASRRALSGGASLRGVLGAVKEARSLTDVPILLFGYYNPLLTYGLDEVVRDSKASGVDGFLVVDLPPEECRDFRERAVNAGLEYVPLVAPTSTPFRQDLAAGVATSFVYCVALKGVTGSSDVDHGDAGRRARVVSERVERPVALGFGIKDREQVQSAAPHVDAVVVGSAVVRAIASAPSDDEAIRAAADLVADLAMGLAFS